MKTENEKCAEVYRHGPGKFTFYCIYCTEQFEMHYGAMEHVESHFPFDENIKTNAEIEPKNSETEKLVYLSAVFIPENEEYNIIDTKRELISKEEYGTETHVLQNEFHQLVLDPVLDHSNYLNEIKVEPTEIRTTIETTTTKKPTKERKKCKKSSKNTDNMYAKFGHIGILEVVECDICKRRAQKKYMLNHMRVHANLKQFVCSICQNRYNLKRAFNKHMQQAHSEPSKQFCCPYCSRQFYDLTNFKSHIIVHTGERPFQCEICGKAYTRFSTLKVHIMRFHTSHTKVKPYKCELCNKSFKNTKAGGDHKRRHNKVKKFKCGTCDKAYLTGDSLRKHNMIHTGERPFSCNICNATFSKRFGYNQHLILHTDEKPYKCRFCDVHFSQMSARRLHERSVHNDIKRYSVI